MRVNLLGRERGGTQRSQVDDGGKLRNPPRRETRIHAGRIFCGLSLGHAGFLKMLCAIHDPPRPPPSSNISSPARLALQNQQRHFTEPIKSSCTIHFPLKEEVIPASAWGQFRMTCVQKLCFTCHWTGVTESRGSLNSSVEICKA